MARYRGLMAANGDWASFVDADDVLLPNAIELLMNNSDGFDLVSGTYAVTDSNLLHPKPYSQWIKEEGIFTGEEFVYGLLNSTRLPNMYRQLIKMDILKAHYILLPREIKIFEDFLFNVNLGLYLTKIKGIPDLVYYYRMQDKSVVHTYKQSLRDAEKIDEVLEEVLKGREQFEGNLLKHRIGEIKRFIADPHLHEASFVKKALKTNKQHSLQFSDRLTLFLCDKHILTRKVIWKCFLLTSFAIVRLRKFIK